MGGMTREAGMVGSARDAAETVVLVDADDRAVGAAPKLEAHRLGLRHRAFSVFLIGADGRWLLQRRAAGKYHSPGLWTNACCGHPRPGEDTAAAAARRLAEELGGPLQPLAPFARIAYRADLDRGMTEDEVATLLVGAAPARLDPDPEEASATAWAEPAALARDLARAPERYTAWLAAYLAALPDLAARAQSALASGSESLMP